MRASDARGAKILAVGNATDVGNFDVRMGFGDGAGRTNNTLYYIIKISMAHHNPLFDVCQTVL